MALPPLARVAGAPDVSAAGRRAYLPV